MGTVFAQLAHITYIIMYIALPLNLKAAHTSHESLYYAANLLRLLHPSFANGYIRILSVVCWNPVGAVFPLVASNQTRIPAEGHPLALLHSLRVQGVSPLTST